MKHLIAEELRIGNIIRMDGNITNVGSIQSNFYGVMINGKGLDTDSFEPIPLTEEILLKCGWMWNEECNAFEKCPNGDARLFISKDNGINGKRKVFNYVLKAYIADVTFLHQLQNLFYSLCGKELEINL